MRLGDRRLGQGQVVVAGASQRVGPRLQEVDLLRQVARARPPAGRPRGSPRSGRSDARRCRSRRCTWDRACGVMMTEAARTSQSGRPARARAAPLLGCAPCPARAHRDALPAAAPRPLGLGAGRCSSCAPVPAATDRLPCLRVAGRMAGVGAPSWSRSGSPGARGRAACAGRPRSTGRSRASLAAAGAGSRRGPLVREPAARDRGRAALPADGAEPVARGRPGPARQPRAAGLPRVHARARRAALRQPAPRRPAVPGAQPRAAAAAGAGLRDRRPRCSAWWCSRCAARRWPTVAGWRSRDGAGADAPERRLAWAACVGPPAFFYAFHVYTELPAALLDRAGAPAAVGRRRAGRGGRALGAAARSRRCPGCTSS